MVSFHANVVSVRIANFKVQMENKSEKFCEKLQKYQSLAHFIASKSS